MLEQLLGISSHEGAPVERWCCHYHTRQWAMVFQSFFPRKAHLVFEVMTALAGKDSFEELERSLPRFCNEEGETCDCTGEWLDPDRFKQDRSLLVRTFRIKPDAANLFLIWCPVGNTHGHFHMEAPVHWNLVDSQCYYEDSELPGANLDSILAHQFDEALGMVMSTFSLSRRIKDYLPPAMYRGFFESRGWKFRPSLGDDEKEYGATIATRLGWFTDDHLGEIECFNMPTWIHPYWLRDEMFTTLLEWISSYTSEPTLILGNRPTQVIAEGHTYTCIGFFFTNNLVLPCFVPNARSSLGDLLVASRLFNPASSFELLDTDNAVFDDYWSRLMTYGKEIDAGPAKYVMLPNYWAVPA